MNSRTETIRWNVLNACLLACCAGLIHLAWTSFQARYPSSQVCRLVTLDETATRWVASILMLIGIVGLFRGLMALQVRYGYATPEEVGLIFAKTQPVILIGFMTIMASICVVRCVASTM